MQHSDKGYLKKSFARSKFMGQIPAKETYSWHQNYSSQKIIIIIIKKKKRLREKLFKTKRNLITAI